MISMVNLFVYGTLMSRYYNPQTGALEQHPRHSDLKVFNHVLGRIDNYILYWPLELDFPFIVPCERKNVIGELYFDIDPTTLAQLDIYEGVSSGYFERKRVKVDTEHGIIAAFTYTGGKFLQENYLQLP